MSRSVSLRRMCSYIVSQRIEEALSATVYIVHQAGPTGFVLKQGESKYKVRCSLRRPAVIMIITVVIAFF